jgi:addiction module HigA family antidote
MKVRSESLPPVHPGEILREEYLRPMNLTPNALAKAICRAAHRAVGGEKIPLTADTALCLARYFGTSAGLWMNMQARYDLEAATL